MFEGLSKIFNLWKTTDTEPVSLFTTFTEMFPRKDKPPNFAEDCLKQARQLANKEGGPDSKQFEQYARDTFSSEAGVKL